jgi:hypothetical protein
MKKFQILASGVLLIASIMGCQKIKDLAPSSNSIMPLALENRWTYVDTIIISSTMPSLDTIISEASFKVEKEAYVDRKIEIDGKSKYQRLHGFELSRSENELEPFALFVIGDTVYTTFPTLLTPISGEPCPGINSDFRELPQLLLTNTGYIAQLIAFPADVNKEFPSFPIFHRPNACAIKHTPIPTSPNLNFEMTIPNLQAQIAKVTVRTEAGTFDCINYGHQFWMEGIGMIRSIYADTTQFIDSNGFQQTGNVEWRRSLKSYEIN